jgi:hypothetical protein
LSPDFQKYVDEALPRFLGTKGWFPDSFLSVLGEITGLPVRITPINHLALASLLRMYFKLRNVIDSMIQESRDWPPEGQAVSPGPLYGGALREFEMLTRISWGKIERATYTRARVSQTLAQARLGLMRPADASRVTLWFFTEAGHENDPHNNSFGTCTSTSWTWPCWTSSGGVVAEGAGMHLTDGSDLLYSPVLVRTARQGAIHGSAPSGEGGGSC